MKFILNSQISVFLKDLCVQGLLEMESQVRSPQVQRYHPCSSGRVGFPPPYC